MEIWEMPEQEEILFELLLPYGDHVTLRSIEELGVTPCGSQPKMLVWYEKPWSRSNGSSATSLDSSSTWRSLAWEVLKSSVNGLLHKLIDYVF
jgi:hypothetical protein